MSLYAGVARTQLNPPWGVELSGWGYYLKRTWQQVRDNTAATALVLDDEATVCALIAVDLMYADADFTARVRREVAAFTSIKPEAICVTCSHSHNTPTAALIRGAGEMDEAYVAWAARQAATAGILAWRTRRLARLSIGTTRLSGWTYNRTREGGPVDDHLTIWRLDDEARGRPLAAVLNFQGHPTAQMSLGATDLSRDVPGQITDIIENALPGITALHVQGACGDLNFNTEYHTPARCHEPARAIAGAALTTWAGASPVTSNTIRTASLQATLPTRRWVRSEVDCVLEEASYRARSGDTTGWLNGFAKVIVNYPSRLPERYGGSVENAVAAVSRFGVEWGEKTLLDLDTRPEVLHTEVQALRIGEAALVANGSEFFGSLALGLRRQWGKSLLIAGYANDSIGYVPDAHDVRAKSYAAYQSPKFKDQFPFTEDSGSALVAAMLETLRRTQ